MRVRCRDPLNMPESTIDRVLLVRSVEQRRPRAGSPFLRLTLGDRAGTLPAVLWDADDAAVQTAQQGAPVRVTGRLDEHPRYGRQLTIETLGEPIDIPWDELRDGPARSIAEIERDLDALIASVAEPHLRALLERLLGRAFREAPAAKFNHHAYAHGLLEHSVDVALMASAAAAGPGARPPDPPAARALLRQPRKPQGPQPGHGPAHPTTPRQAQGGGPP